jgi:alkanesulfonate monooxygenase SsuD/methylene tetrahydromethanopterin reductase-like flavin-dependent oxidoreductase (luciferase family)
MTGYAAMRAYREDVRARAVAHGRNADDIKVFFQVSPILGATMAEAKAREAQMIANAKANLDQGFVTITMTAGIDLSSYPHDMPMSKLREIVSTDYGKSSLEDIFNWAGDMTLEDFVSFPPRWRIFQPVGTPESVASEMAELMQEVGGDGFLVNIMGDTNRHSLAMLTDGLVPVLQKRGLMRKEYGAKTFRENLLAF